MLNCMYKFYALFYGIYFRIKTSNKKDGTEAENVSSTFSHEATGGWVPSKQGSKLRKKILDPENRSSTQKRDRGNLKMMVNDG